MTSISKKIIPFFATGLLILNFLPSGNTSVDDLSSTIPPVNQQIGNTEDPDAPERERWTISGAEHEYTKDNILIYFLVDDTKSVIDSCPQGASLRYSLPWFFIRLFDAMAADLYDVDHIHLGFATFGDQFLPAPITPVTQLREHDEWKDLIPFFQNPDGIYNNKFSDTHFELAFNEVNNQITNNQENKIEFENIYIFLLTDGKRESFSSGKNSDTKAALDILLNEKNIYLYHINLCENKDVKNRWTKIAGVKNNYIFHESKKVNEWVNEFLISEIKQFLPVNGYWFDGTDPNNNTITLDPQSYPGYSILNIVDPVQLDSKNGNADISILVNDKNHHDNIIAPDSVCSDRDVKIQYPLGSTGFTWVNVENPSFFINNSAPLRFTNNNSFTIKLDFELENRMWEKYLMNWRDCFKIEELIVEGADVINIGNCGGDICVRDLSYQTAWKINPNVSDEDIGKLFAGNLKVTPRIRFGNEPKAQIFKISNEIEPKVVSRTFYKLENSIWRLFIEVDFDFKQDVEISFNVKDDSFSVNRNNVPDGFPGRPTCPDEGLYPIIKTEISKENHIVKLDDENGDNGKEVIYKIEGGDYILDDCQVNEIKLHWPGEKMDNITFLDTTLICEITSSQLACHKPE